MTHIFASKLSRSFLQRASPVSLSYGSNLRFATRFGRFSPSFTVQPKTTCLSSPRRTFCATTSILEGSGNGEEDDLVNRVLFNDEDDEFDQAKVLEELVKENAEKVTMLPSQVVSELDKFIVGQKEAKKAIAIALRNRYRRQKVSGSLKDEIIPKNILMIGPTGSGKTEIARRIAKLHKSPFVKVEATKYTEVGFHGKDVDTIIQDLADAGIELMKQNLVQRLKEKMKKHIDKKIIKILVTGSSDPADEENYKAMLESGALENSLIEYNIPKKHSMPAAKLVGEVLITSLMNPKPRPLFDSTTTKVKPKKYPLHVVRKHLEDDLIDKLVSEEDIKTYALQLVQNDGIVFIDEVDKICNRGDNSLRTSASDEGVQRDLLPIIEGTNVSTKHGTIDTSKILFIASGAFHDAKPSDLLPEFQGRLPIRVELKPLALEDFYRILTDTENSLIKQQIELMKTEGINLTFTEGAIREIATICFELNQNIENIGARRLHTVIEKIVEDISFNCENKGDLLIDEKYVRNQLQPLMQKQDLRRFIL